MFQYISKNKGLLVLLAVVLAGLLWMTSQVREPGGPSLLERGVNSAAYPFVKAVDMVSRAASGVWEGYFYLVGLVKENEMLTRQNAVLSAENTALKEKEARSKRLAGLWEMAERSEIKTLPAQVIGRDPTSWFRSALVDAGTDEGVAKNMPVTVYCGLVGRIIKPFPASSRLMIITHPASSISCLIERSRDTGILTGDGTGVCRLDYVEKLADVKEGDLVITSGLDRVYPKGLPVGVVTRVRQDAPGYFQDVRVEPTADLDHLEDVLVMMYKPEERQ